MERQNNEKKREKRKKKRFLYIEIFVLFALDDFN